MPASLPHFTGLDRAVVWTLMGGMRTVRSGIADPWFYPINTAITLFCSCLPPGRLGDKKFETTSSHCDRFVFNTV